MGERRWPGQRSEMVTWLRALRNGCVSCFFRDRGLRCGGVS